MEMPVIGLLYAVLCGRWLLAENLKSNGLNPLHWHRSAVHVPEAVGQAAQLTIILLGFDLFLRMGKARKAVK
ncbi:MAG: hypothetical protein J7498_05135 [Sphingobium sp.]|nr:hypothetical protein [Sphingobium sp.]